MENRLARARPPETYRRWTTLVITACASVTGCVAPPAGGVRAPASTQSVADDRAEPSHTKLLFHAAKWERNGGAYPEVVRETKVIIDVKAAEAEETLRIKLPDMEPLLVLRTIDGKKERMANGALVWSARVNDSRYETAAFAIVEGVLTASIGAPNGRAYRIRHLKSDVYLLQEIDRSKFPPEECKATEKIRGELPQLWHDRVATTRVQSTLCVPEDPPTSIEVMVVYSDAALVEAQSAPTMIGAIENAFRQTNTSYASSGIEQRIRPVYPFVHVHYTEESSITMDLGRLKDVNDSQLSDVHAKREALAADIVILVTHTSGTCGLASVMTNVSTAFAARAFAVVPYRCLTDTFSFAHELGHLMGARHDVNQDAMQNSPFPFNHGFVRTHPIGGAPHPWFTVMGTPTQCTRTWTKDCARIAFWSTPDIQFDYYGEATGVADQADNRRTLNATASIVANFVCSSTRVPLVATIASKPVPAVDSGKSD
jgi:Metallo-peptidase family M12